LAVELHRGKGFFVVRGLNPNAYSLEDNTIIFLGMSSYIGEKRGKQTDDGRIFSHLRNAVEMNASQQNRPLKDSNRFAAFHNDVGCDIVAIQTKSCSETGGNHFIGSSAMIFNELMATRPDLLQALMDPDWPLDMRRRWSLTETRPLFFCHDSKVIASILPDALLGLEDVERTPDLPIASEKQTEALSAVQDLAHKYQLTLSMQPGDLTFINNYGIVHGRESFEDSPAHRRYLVRLWLKNEELAWKLPPALQLANQMVFYDDSLAEDWNITPARRIKFQIYERASP